MLFGVSIAAAAAVSCASGQTLTQGDVGREGTRNFAAPPEAMFYASIGVLKANGYDIARADRRDGIIVTKPKAVSSKGPITARAYRFTIWPAGGGSQVIATPLAYAGSRDVSNDPVWQMGGDRGERARWNRLFQDLDGVVIRTDVGKTEREALAKEAVPVIEPGPTKADQPSHEMKPAGFAPATK